MNIDAWQWQREHKKNFKKIGFCPSTPIRRRKRIFYSPVWPTINTYLVKTVTQNASFQKRSPEWRFLKTLASRLRFGRTKPAVFEYDDVIHHILLAWRMYRKWCYRISIVLAFSCERTKTIRIRYVWTRIFFENGEKNLRLQKYLVTCGPGFKVMLHDTIRNNDF